MVGCPWIGVSLWLILVNWVLNIFMNEYWAGGNPLLLFNTVYITVQTILSWPLIFEIPFWVTKTKFIRLMSCYAAYIYTGVYFIIVMSWAVQVYFMPENFYEEYQFVDILVNMLYAYCLIFHLHVLPVNLMIIGKEFFLDIFPPLLEQDAGDELTP